MTLEVAASGRSGNEAGSQAKQRGLWPSVQFVQLAAWGYPALVFYLIFDVCLYGLIHQISGRPE